MKAVTQNPFKLALTAIALFLLTSLSAQWTNIYTNGGYSRIKFLNNSVGYVQEIYSMQKTIDGGVTWNTVDVNTSTYVRTDMFWLNTNEGYVVFYENLGFGNYAGWFKKTSNGGSTWTAMQQLPVNQLYSAVWFTSSLVGYVAGSNGVLLKTVNGGTSWTTLTTGTTEDLYSIYFPSATIGYVGGDNGIILKTINSGTSWATQFSSIFWEFNDLCFTDNLNGMAVGTYGMMRTTNGGSTWNPITGTNVTQFLSVDFPSADTGYVTAVGGNVFRTIDGGATWLGLNHVGQGYFVRDVSFVDNNNGYVVADYSGVWQTTNAGTGCPTMSINNSIVSGPDTLHSCAGSNAVFTAAASASNSYIYTFNPISAIDTAASYGQYYYATSPNAGDTVLITLTMSDPFTGCPSVTDSVVLITDSITYQPPPMSTQLVLLCPGDSVDLDLGANAQDGYLWQFTGETTQIKTVDTIGLYMGTAYACGGQYMWVYVVQWNTNCSSSVCAVDAGVDTTFCQQQGQLFATPASPGNYDFSWSPATGLDNPFAQNPNVISGVANQQYIVTMFDSASSCMATDTVIISAYYFHNGPVYSCFPDSALLDFGPGASSYFWQFFTDTNNVTVGINATTQTYYATEPGTYSGIAMFPGCGALTSVFNVIDSCGPLSVCAVNAGPDTMFCQQQGQLSATPASPGNYTFSWSPTTGLDNPFAQNPNVISGVHNQQYVVTMTDVAANCTATDTVIVSAYYFHSDTLYSCNNQPVIIDLGPGGTNYTYQFTDTASVFHFGQMTNQYYTATQPAQYLFIAYFANCGALTSVITVIDSCNVQVNNVWPGDCNYDLSANMADALHIGLGYGATGATRPNASNLWYAQPMADWTQNYTNCNYKHGDADGNGTIDVNDTVPISLNYGNTHPFRLAPQVNPTAVPELYLVANYDTVGLQTLVTVDVRLGTSAFPVDSLYGISFRLRADAALIDTTLTFVNLNSTWLGTTGSNLFNFRKYSRNNGSVDCAQSRNNHINFLNGNGTIATFLIVTTDNLSGIAICHIDVTDVTAVTASQAYLALATVNDSVVIDPSMPAGMGAQEIAPSFSIYPNPANESVTIQSSTTVSQIEITDMLGRVITTITPTSLNTTINTAAFAEGVYLLRLRNGNSVTTQKLSVTH